MVTFGMFSAHTPSSILQSMNSPMLLQNVKLSTGLKTELNSNLHHLFASFSDAFHQLTDNETAFDIPQEHLLGKSIANEFIQTLETSMMQTVVGGGDRSNP